MLHHVLKRMTESRPREQRSETRNAVVAAVESGGTPRSLLEEFDALEPRWTPPSQTGFEPKAAA